MFSDNNITEANFLRQSGWRCILVSEHRQYKWSHSDTLSTRRDCSCGDLSQLDSTQP